MVLAASMELHSFLTVALISTSTLVILFYFVIRGLRDRRCKPLPSPWKLPIVGHIHHLVMGGDCPHRTLRDLAAKHGPVMLLKLGEVDHIVISSPDAAKEITKTHDLNFASRASLLFSEVMTYGGKDIAFAPYGPYWRQLRKICALELMSLTRVKSFSPIRAEAIAGFVSEIISISSTGSPVNLSSMLVSLSTLIVSRAAFGKESKHAKLFMSTVKEVMDLATGFSFTDMFPSWSLIATLTGERRRLEKIHRELDGMLSEIIEEHVEKGSSRDGEDLVDVLLRLMDHGGLEVPLTVTNIKAVIFDVFIGGTDNSSITLEWAMSELLLQPELMKKVQSEVRGAAGAKGTVEEVDIEEMRYMKQIVKETLRLHTPGPLLLPRVGAETREVGGFSIPAGSRVLVNVWAMARDPRYWEDPESFRPERFDGSSADFRGGSFEFLPFGAGRRICPGLEFAMAGIETALAHLLFHFDWELPDGMKADDLDMTESFRTGLGRKSPLRLVAIPRVPVPEL